MKKKYIFKSIIIILFMFFICHKTINYLVSNITISNEEYIKLILSDTYKTKENNFYYNATKFFSNLFRPIDMLNLPNTNQVITNSTYVNNPNIKKIYEPIIYIYNTNQLQEYKNNELFNITPNVMMTSIILNEKLNKIGISSIMCDNKKNINKYPSIKYIIDISRNDIDNGLIKFNNLNYAKIRFITSTNDENIDLILKLNTKLNELYLNISDIKYDSKLQEDEILLEIGNINNNFNEVLNTIDVLINVFKEAIYE